MSTIEKYLLTGRAKAVLPEARVQVWDDLVSEVDSGAKPLTLLSQDFDTNFAQRLSKGHTNLNFFGDKFSELSKPLEALPNHNNNLVSTVTVNKIVPNAAQAWCRSV